MIRNLKALGLALFALLALGAMMASGASASVEIFHSEVSPTFFEGTSDEGEGSTGTQVFKTAASGGAEVVCHHAEFTKTTVTGTAVSTIEVGVDYTTPTCTGPSGTEVHVDFATGECGYHFTGTASKTAIAKLICKKAGGSVTLTPTLFGSSLCTIHIAPQTPGGHVTFHTVADPVKTAVTAEATSTEIKSTRTGSSLCGAESSTTGTYTGNALITGYKDTNGVKGEQVNVSVS